MANRFLPKVPADFKLPLKIIAVGETHAERKVCRKNGYPAYHCMLCKDGRGSLTVEGKEYIVEPDSVFFLLPRQPHQYHSIGGAWHTCWVVFTGKGAESILHLLALDSNAPRQLSKDCSAFLHFQHIYHLAEKGDLACHYKCSAQLYALLLDIAAFQPIAFAQQSAAQRIAPVLSYLCDHWQENIGLGELSSVLQISPQYLCKLFDEALRTSPYDYLIGYRLQRAKEMMADHNLTIKEISSLTGFHDASYFCAVFKKQEGLTPGQFREMFFE